MERIRRWLRAHHDVTGQSANALLSNQGLPTSESWSRLTISPFPSRAPGPTRERWSIP